MARSRIVARHHTQLLAVRVRTAELVGGAWDRYGGPSDDNLDAFTRTAVPIVVGAQRRTVALMGAYMGAMLAGRPGATVPLDAAAIVAATRNGADPRDVYTRPVITMRMLLAEGVLFVDAFTRSRQRAEVVAATDVMLANRDAATAVMSAENRIERFERVLSPTACDLCAGAAGQTYSSDDPLPMHAACDCDVAPIIDGEEAAASNNEDVLASDPNAVDVVTDPAGEERRLEVTVEQHGELGPVLVDAHHTFTGSPAE